MKLPTLAEFTSRPLGCRNSYLCVTGFSKFYARVSKRKYDNFEGWWFDIVRIEAEIKGRGTFTRLLDELHPKVNIYVESVLTVDFAEYLRRRGFTDCGGLCPSFYLHKTDELRGCPCRQNQKRNMCGVTRRS